MLRHLDRRAPRLKSFSTRHRLCNLPTQKPGSRRAFFARKRINSPRQRHDLGLHALAGKTLIGAQIHGGLGVVRLDSDQPGRRRARFTGRADVGRPRCNVGADHCHAVTIREFSNSATITFLTQITTNIRRCNKLLYLGILMRLPNRIILMDKRPDPIWLRRRRLSKELKLCYFVIGRQRSEGPWTGDDDER